MGAEIERIGCRTEPRFHRSCGKVSDEGEKVAIQLTSTHEGTGSFYSMALRSYLCTVAKLQWVSFLEEI
jgi:hypothetical protein